jgi:hypothetical protein
VGNIEGSELFNHIELTTGSIQLRKGSILLKQAQKHVLNILQSDSQKDTTGQYTIFKSNGCRI